MLRGLVASGFCHSRWLSLPVSPQCFPFHVSCPIASLVSTLAHLAHSFFISPHLSLSIPQRSCLQKQRSHPEVLGVRISACECQRDIVSAWHCPVAAGSWQRCGHQRMFTQRPYSCLQPALSSYLHSTLLPSVVPAQ